MFSWVYYKNFQNISSCNFTVSNFTLLSCISLLNHSNVLTYSLWRKVITICLVIKISQITYRIWTYFIIMDSLKEGDEMISQEFFSVRLKLRTCINMHFESEFPFAQYHPAHHDVTYQHLAISLLKLHCV